MERKTEEAEDVKRNLADVTTPAIEQMVAVRDRLNREIYEARRVEAARRGWLGGTQKGREASRNDERRRMNDD